MIRLKEITAESYRAILALDVSDKQKAFVAPNARSIADAYFEKRAWFRGIYSNDTPVGFVMLFIDTEKSEYFLWRFMIDKRFQKNGFGAQAMALVIEYVRGLPRASELKTSVVQDEGGPQQFYERLGFELTGEYEEDEAVMSLTLS